MSGTKIVKRYANRKLYDTERSCYVTLDDISTMIKSGEEVQVIDNKSGDDLTSVTLAQIIFETEKKAHFMPLNLLRGLIQQSGENIGGFAREQVETVQSRAQDIRDTASDTVTRITSQFGETVGRVIKPGGEGEEGEGAVEGAADAGKQSPASVKDMLSSSQKNLEEIQRGIEDRVQEGLGVVSEGFSREVEDILERLGSLKERFRK
jgi:polyhydroxyalkanoate synthesis repressor PhaR